MENQLNSITASKNEKRREAYKTLRHPRNLIVTSENRGTVRAFLNGLGFPADWYDGMKLQTLDRCYASILDYPSHPYLCGILRNKDASPSDFQQLKSLLESDLHALQANGVTWASDALAKAGLQSQDEPQDEPEPLLVWDDIPEPAAEPEPTPEPANIDDDDAAQLAKLIAKMAGTKSGPLDEARVIELVKEHAPKPERFTVSLITKDGTKDLPDAIRHEVFPHALDVLANGLNLLLVGPAGSGKTTIAKQMAEALDVPFYFNGAIASEYKLSGFIDAKGEIVSSPFREAYINGGLYLFDEVDASLNGALMAFNAALAGEHADFPDGVHNRHPDFRCVAAANTYGHGADRVYVGRNQLDGAFLDRFIPLGMGYDETLERTISGNDEWTREVQKIRAAVSKLKLRHVVSPRASMAGAKLLAAGWSKKDVLEATVWKGLDKDTQNKITAL